MFFAHPRSFWDAPAAFYPTTPHYDKHFLPSFEELPQQFFEPAVYPAPRAEGRQGRASNESIKARRPSCDPRGAQPAAAHHHRGDGAVPGGR